MAGKKIGLVLALDGEKEFKSAIKSVKEEVKLYQDSLKNLDKAYESNRNSMDALTKKQEALTKKQEAYKKQVDAAKNGLDNAKKQYNEQAEALEKLKTKLNDAERELKQMADAGDTTSDAYKRQKQEVDSLREAVGKQTDNLNKAQTRVNQWTREVNNADAALDKCDKELKDNSKYLDEASKSADFCATSIDRYGKEVTEADKDTGKFTVSLKDMVKNKLVDLGGDILRDLAQKAVEAAKYVIEVGSSFESAMSKVQALSGASGAQLDSMAQKAKELGASTKFSATEVAEAFSYMALAGWDTQSMLEAVDGVVNLAASSEMDLAQASDMVTDYLTAFGLEASDAAHMVDMLAYAQANSNTTTQQLGEAWGNCAASMHAAGQDAETTTAILEAFANQGLKGSEAGTKLAAIMRDITAKMEDGKIQIGETAVAVMDSNGNFRDMTDILADVEKATDGMGTAEQAAALQTTFTSRSVQGLNMILTEGVGSIASYEEQLRSSDGTAAAMATTMQDNLGGKITALNSALGVLGIAVYNYVSGPVKKVVETVTGIISGITTAITPQKTELETFIEDIGKSNAEVERSIKNAKDTEDKANAEVSKLETAKEFLQGVLDNCTQFNETDLSAAGQKIVTDLQPAEQEFKNVGESAGEAVESIEGIGEVHISDDMIGHDLATINTAIDKTSITAEEAQKVVGGIGADKLDHSNLDSSLEEMNVEFDDWGERGTYNNDRIVKAVNEATLEGSPLHGDLRTLTAEAQELGNAAEGSGEKIVAVGDSVIDTANIDTASGTITEDMGSVQSAANDATGALEAPGKIKPVTITQKISAAAESIIKRQGEIQTSAEEADKAIEGIGGDTSGIDGATKALGYLKDAESGVIVVQDEFTKTRITNIVNQLRDTVPELADAWNENTGELSLTNEQLVEYIKNAENAAKTKAYAEALQTLYEALYTAEINASMAESALNEARKESNELLQEQSENIATNWVEQEKYAESRDRAAEAESAANGELEEAQENYKNAQAEVARLSKIIKDLGLDIDLTTGEIIEQSEATETGTENTEKAVSQAELLINALGGVSNAENEATESTNGLTKAQSESLKAFQEMAKLNAEGMVELMNTMGMTADQFAEWCQEQVDYIEDLEDSYDKLLENVTNALEGYVQSLDASGEEGSQAIDNIISNLESRNKDLETWVENMKKLGAMAGDGLPQELYDHLLAEGPEKTMEAVQALVDAAEGETGKFEQVASEYNRSLAIKNEAAVLTSYTQIGKDYAKAVESGFIGTKDDYENTVQDLVNSGVLKAEESSEAYSGVGESAGKKEAQGMKEQEGLIETTSKAVVQAGFKTANTAADVFKTVGQVSMSRLSIGMNNFRDTPINRAKEIVEAAASKAKISAANFKDVGKEADDKIAQGMKLNRNTSNDMAREVMEKAAEAAKGKTSLFRTPGENAGKALGDGIYSQNGYVVQAAAGVAANASYAPYSYYSSFYSAGSYIIAGLANGISANAYQAAYAAASAARSAYSAAASAVAVASPSKKFYEIGKYIDEGFALGISENQKMVEKAADEAARTSIEAANRNLKLQSTLDIVGAERLNEMGKVQTETADTATAIKNLTAGMRALSRLAESLTNPKEPNVTVMIGNREFKGYIVDTAIEGMGAVNQSLMRGVGA